MVVAVPSVAVSNSVNDVIRASRVWTEGGEGRKKGGSARQGGDASWPGVREPVGRGLWPPLS